jgi:hypothetical protein
MSSLENLFEDWMNLFRRVQENGQVAGPFLSVNSAERCAVLLVGKATRGAWYREKLQGSTTVQEWRQQTSEFIRGEIEAGYTTPFWSFARTLQQELRPHSEGRGLPNIVWSNLCKLGVINGNPEGAVLKLQRELAIETLRAEIAEYAPNLVVFLTSGYGPNMVPAIVDDLEHRLWNKEEEETGLWWRDRSESMPPIIWTDHPELRRVKGHSHRAHGPQKRNPAGGKPSGVPPGSRLAQGKTLIERID